MNLLKNLRKMIILELLDTGETAIIEKVEKSKEEDDNTKYFLLKV